MSLGISKITRRLLQLMKVVLVIAIIGIFVLLINNENKLEANKPSRQSEQDISTPEAMDVDEDEITETQKIDYVVTPEKPRFLSIEKLGIVKARILEVGVLKDGKLDAPKSIFDTGWYNASGLPGSSEVALIDGHSGGLTKNGVFSRLGELREGDEVVVERGDGEVFTYIVVENTTFSLDEAEVFMSIAVDSVEKGTGGLNLLTCTGEWSTIRSTYNKRVLVRAILKTEL